MNEHDIENHMVIGNKDEKDGSAEYDKMFAQTQGSASSVFFGGDMQEIIEGQTREYWLNYAMDIIAMSPERVINILNPHLDANETAKEIREIAEIEIHKEMVRNYE